MVLLLIKALSLMDLPIKDLSIMDLSSKVLAIMLLTICAKLAKKTMTNMVHVKDLALQVGDWLE